MRKRAHEAWKAAGTALGIVPPQPDEQLPKCTDLEILGAQRYAVTVRWNCAAAVTTAVQLEPEKRMKSLGCGYRPRFYEVRLMDCKQGERIEKREVNPRDPRDTEMCAVVPKLRPGTEYEVSVRASPGPGRGWSPGDWSEPATVTTPAQGPCGADLQAEAADVADCLAAASAMLEWGDQEAHLACNGYASRLCRVLDSEVRSHDYCMFYQNEGNALIIAFASAQNYIRAIAGEPDATRHCALEGRLKHFTLLVQRLCGVPVQAGTSPKPSSRLYDDDTTPEQLLETVISIAPVVNDRLLQPERVLFTGFAGGGAAATDALCEVLRRLRPAGGSPHFPADEPWTRRVRCVTFAAPFQQCRVHSLRFCPLFEHHVLGGDAAVCAPLLTKDQRKALERELRTAAVAANRRPAETSDVTGEDHLHLLGDGCQLRAARRGLHAGSSGLSWQLPPGAVHTLQQGMLRMYTGRTPTCFDGDCAGGAVCSHDSGKVRAQVFSPEDYARALPAPWSDEKNLAPTVDSGTARCVCCDTWIVLHLTGRNLLHTRMVQMQLTGGGTEVMELTRVDAGRLCARMKLQMTEAVIKGLTDGERAEGVVMTDFGDIRFAATMSIDKDLQPVMRHARKYLDMPVGNVLSHALTAAFRDVDMTEEHRQRGARATQYVPPFEMQVMPLDERDASHSLHILFQTGKVAGTDGPDSRQSPRRSEEPTSCLPSWTGEQGGCSVVADEGRWRMRVGGVTWVSKRELECTDWRTGISRVVWPHEMEWVGPPVRVVRRPNDIRERLLGLELVKCICQPDGASRDLLRWLLLPMKDAREPENLVLPDLFDKFSGVDSGHDLQLAAAEAAPRLAAIVALCDALCWFTFKEATVPQVTRFTSEVFLITGGVGLFLGGPCGAAANIAALTCTLGPAAAHVRQCNRMSYTLSKYAEKLDFFLSLLRQRDADAIPAETFYHKEVLVYRAMREALSTKTLIISGRPSAEVALPGLHLHGCIVDSVDKDSPAADHGFVQGMRIVRVNETEVDEPDALSALMKAKKYYEVEVVQGGSDECQAWRRLRECPGRRLSEVMTLFDFFVEIKSRWTYLFGKPHEWRPNLRPAQQIAGTFDEQDTELFVGLMWAVITTHELRASLMEFFELHVIGHKNAGKSTLVSATFGVTTKSGGSTDGATLLPVQYTVPGMEHFRVVDGAGSNDARTRAGSLQVLGESQCASHHLVLASHDGLQRHESIVSIASLMVTGKQRPDGGDGRRPFTVIVSQADMLVVNCGRKCPRDALADKVASELQKLEDIINKRLRAYKDAFLCRAADPSARVPHELEPLLKDLSAEELVARAARIYDVRHQDWVLVAVDPCKDSATIQDLLMEAESGGPGLLRYGVLDTAGLRYRIQEVLIAERQGMRFPPSLPAVLPIPMLPAPVAASAAAAAPAAGDAAPAAEAAAPPA
eukprot:TRINITY_DN195_c0_g1_i4.p1 TRINITY_DN195_c0_g1~~TRINITY_DN195_c0_g1_i4.p1  ORF type:complete len:1435 (+),score=283.88 TRINITY_DN195_c0_g1_i4:78-4382(+)